MDRTDCLRDKLSSRTVGFILLGFSLIIAFAGFLIVPVLGVFFALPLLALPADHRQKRSLGVFPRSKVRSSGPNRKRAAVPQGNAMG